MECQQTIVINYYKITKVVHGSDWPRGVGAQEYVNTVVVFRGRDIIKAIENCFPVFA